jgi:hypothetical protein
MLMGPNRAKVKKRDKGPKNMIQLNKIIPKKLAPIDANPMPPLTSDLRMSGSRSDRALYRPDNHATNSGTRQAVVTNVVEVDELDELLDNGDDEDGNGQTEVSEAGGSYGCGLLEIRMS